MTQEPFGTAHLLGVIVASATLSFIMLSSVLLLNHARFEAMPTFLMA